MRTFVTGFFQLACFQDSLMVCHVSILDSFLLPNSIPMYGYAAFYLAVFFS